MNSSNNSLIPSMSQSGLGALGFSHLDLLQPQLNTMTDPTNSTLSGYYGIPPPGSMSNTLHLMNSNPPPMTMTQPMSQSLTMTQPMSQNFIHIDGSYLINQIENKSYEIGTLKTEKEFYEKQYTELKQQFDLELAKKKSEVDQNSPQSQPNAKGVTKSLDYGSLFKNNDHIYSTFDTYYEARLKKRIHEDHIVQSEAHIIKELKRQQEIDKLQTQNEYEKRLNDLAHQLSTLQQSQHTQHSDMLRHQRDYEEKMNKKIQQLNEQVEKLAKTAKAQNNINTLSVPDSTHHVSEEIFNTRLNHLKDVLNKDIKEVRERVEKLGEKQNKLNTSIGSSTQSISEKVDKKLLTSQLNELQRKITTECTTLVDAVKKDVSLQLTNERNNLEKTMITKQNSTHEKVNNYSIQTKQELAKVSLTIQRVEKGEKVIVDEFSRLADRSVHQHDELLRLREVSKQLTEHCHKLIEKSIQQQTLIDHLVQCVQQLTFSQPSTATSNSTSSTENRHATHLSPSLKPRQSTHPSTTSTNTTSNAANVSQQSSISNDSLRQKALGDYHFARLQDGTNPNENNKNNSQIDVPFPSVHSHPHSQHGNGPAGPYFGFTSDLPSALNNMDLFQLFANNKRQHTHTLQQQVQQQQQQQQDNPSSQTQSQTQTTQSQHDNHLQQYERQQQIQRHYQTLITNTNPPPAHHPIYLEFYELYGIDLHVPEVWQELQRYPYSQFVNFLNATANAITGLAQFNQYEQNLKDVSEKRQNGENCDQDELLDDKIDKTFQFYRGAKDMSEAEIEAKRAQYVQFLREKGKQHLEKEKKVHQNFLNIESEASPDQDNGKVDSTQNDSTPQPSEQSKPTGKIQKVIKVVSTKKTPIPTRVIHDTVDVTTDITSTLSCDSDPPDKDDTGGTDGSCKMDSKNVSNSLLTSMNGGDEFNASTHAVHRSIFETISPDHLKSTRFDTLQDPQDSTRPFVQQQRIRRSSHYHSHVQNVQQSTSPPLATSTTPTIPSTSFAQNSFCSSSTRTTLPTSVFTSSAHTSQRTQPQSNQFLAFSHLHNHFRFDDDPFALSPHMQFSHKKPYTQNPSDIRFSHHSYNKNNPTSTLHIEVLDDDTNSALSSSNFDQISQNSTQFQPSPAQSHSIFTKARQLIHTLLSHAPHSSINKKNRLLSAPPVDCAAAFPASSQMTSSMPSSSNLSIPVPSQESTTPFDRFSYSPCLIRLLLQSIDAQNATSCAAFLPLWDEFQADTAFKAHLESKFPLNGEKSENEDNKNRDQTSSSFPPADTIQTAITINTHSNEFHDKHQQEKPEKPEKPEEQELIDGFYFYFIFRSLPESQSLQFFSPTPSVDGVSTSSNSTDDENTQNGVKIPSPISTGLDLASLLSSMSQLDLNFNKNNNNINKIAHTIATNPVSFSSSSAPNPAQSHNNIMNDGYCIHCLESHHHREDYIVNQTDLFTSSDKHNIQYRLYIAQQIILLKKHQLTLLTPSISGETEKEIIPTPVYGVHHRVTIDSFLSAICSDLYIDLPIPTSPAQTISPHLPEICTPQEPNCASEIDQLDPPNSLQPIASSTTPPKAINTTASKYVYDKFGSRISTPITSEIIFEHFSTQLLDWILDERRVPLHRLAILEGFIRVLTKDISQQLNHQANDFLDANFRSSSDSPPIQNPTDNRVDEIMNSIENAAKCDEIDQHDGTSIDSENEGNDQFTHVYACCGENCPSEHDSDGNCLLELQLNHHSFFYNQRHKRENGLRTNKLAFPATQDQFALQNCCCSCHPNNNTDSAINSTNNSLETPHNMTANVEIDAIDAIPSSKFQEKQSNVEENDDSSPPSDKYIRFWRRLLDTVQQHPVIHPNEPADQNGVVMNKICGKIIPQDTSSAKPTQTNSYSTSVINDQRKRQIIITRLRYLREIQRDTLKAALDWDQDISHTLQPIQFAPSYSAITTWIFSHFFSHLFPRYILRFRSLLLSNIDFSPIQHQIQRFIKLKYQNSPYIPFLLPSTDLDALELPNTSYQCTTFRYRRLDTTLKLLSAKSARQLFKIDTEIVHLEVALQLLSRSIIKTQNLSSTHNQHHIQPHTRPFSPHFSSPLSTNAMRAKGSLYSSMNMYSHNNIHPVHHKKTICCNNFNQASSANNFDCMDPHCPDRLNSSPTCYSNEIYHKTDDFDEDRDGLNYSQNEKTALGLLPPHLRYSRFFQQQQNQNTRNDQGVLNSTGDDDMSSSNLTRSNPPEDAPQDTAKKAQKKISTKIQPSHLHFNPNGYGLAQSSTSLAQNENDLDSIDDFSTLYDDISQLTNFSDPLLMIEYYQLYHEHLQHKSTGGCPLHSWLTKQQVIINNTKQAFLVRQQKILDKQEYQLLVKKGDILLHQKLLLVEKIHSLELERDNFVANGAAGKDFPNPPSSHIDNQNGDVNADDDLIDIALGLTNIPKTRKSTSKLFKGSKETKKSNKKTQQNQQSSVDDNINKIEYFNNKLTYLQEHLSTISSKATLFEQEKETFLNAMIASLSVTKLPLADDTISTADQDNSNDNDANSSNFSKNSSSAFIEKLQEHDPDAISNHLTTFADLSIFFDDGIQVPDEMLDNFDELVELITHQSIADIKIPSHLHCCPFCCATSFMNDQTDEFGLDFEPESKSSNMVESKSPLTGSFDSFHIFDKMLRQNPSFQQNLTLDSPHDQNEDDYDFYPHFGGEGDDIDAFFNHNQTEHNKLIQRLAKNATLNMSSTINLNGGKTDGKTTNTTSIDHTSQPRVKMLPSPITIGQLLKYANTMYLQHPTSLLYQGLTTNFPKKFASEINVIPFSYWNLSFKTVLTPTSNQNIINIANTSTISVNKSDENKSHLDIDVNPINESPGGGTTSSYTLIRTSSSAVSDATLTNASTIQPYPIPGGFLSGFGSLCPDIYNVFEPIEFQRFLQCIYNGEYYEDVDNVLYQLFVRSGIPHTTPLQYQQINKLVEGYQQTGEDAEQKRQQLTITVYYCRLNYAHHQNTIATDHFYAFYPTLCHQIITAVPFSTIVAHFYNRSIESAPTSPLPKYSYMSTLWFHSFLNIFHVIVYLSGAFSLKRQPTIELQDDYAYIKTFLLQLLNKTTNNNISSGSPTPIPTKTPQIIHDKKGNKKGNKNSNKDNIKDSSTTISTPATASHQSTSIVNFVDLYFVILYWVKHLYTQAKISTPSRRHIISTHMFLSFGRQDVDCADLMNFLNCPVFMELAFTYTHLKSDLNSLSTASAQVNDPNNKPQVYDLSSYKTFATNTASIMNSIKYKKVQQGNTSGLTNTASIAADKRQQMVILYGIEQFNKLTWAPLIQKILDDPKLLTHK